MGGDMAERISTGWGLLWTGLSLPVLSVQVQPRM